MRERRKRSQNKVRGKKGANLADFLLKHYLDYFLALLGASLIFTIRMSNFFFVHNYLINDQ